MAFQEGFEAWREVTGAEEDRTEPAGSRAAPGRGSVPGPPSLKGLLLQVPTRARTPSVGGP